MNEGGGSLGSPGRLRRRLSLVHSPGPAHNNSTKHAIQEQLENDEKWVKRSRSKFLGSPYDAVDILLRLCRGPCNKQHDRTVCDCTRSRESQGDSPKWYILVGQASLLLTMSTCLASLFPSTWWIVGTLVICYLTYSVVVCEGIDGMKQLDQSVCCVVVAICGAYFGSGIGFVLAVGWGGCILGFWLWFRRDYIKLQKRVDLPSRVATYEVLSNLLGATDANGEALKCSDYYPKSLISFLEEYQKATKNHEVSSPRKSTICEAFFRWLMLEAPVGSAIVLDSNVLGKLKRSPAFEQDSKYLGAEETQMSVLDFSRGISSRLTGVAATVASVPSPPPAWDFFLHHGGFLTFEDAIGIELVVSELVTVNEAEGTFEVMMDITVYWYDADHSSEEWKVALEDAEQGADVLVTSYCAPCIVLKDVSDGDDGWYNHKHVAEEARLIAQGIVSKTISLRSTIRDNNPIHDFPFDTQELTVELELSEADKRGSVDYGRYMIPFAVRFEPRHDIRGWSMHTPVAHVVHPRGHTQTLICAARITRKSEKYMWSNVLPLFLLSMLAFYTLVVPIDSADARGSITVTLLLAAVEFQKNLSEKLPSVTYLTLLDKYILACFVTIFLIAIENGIIAYITGIEKTMSCGEFISDKIKSGQDESIIISNGGECIGGSFDKSDEEAVALETEAFKLMFSAWVGYNLYFAARMIGMVHRNSIMFGPALSVHNDDDDKDVVRDKLADCAKNMDKKAIYNRRKNLEREFECRRFVTPHSKLPSGPSQEKEGKRYVLSHARSIEQNELMAVLLNAGFGRRESSVLVPTLLKKGLSVERLEVSRAMSLEVLSDWLGEISIPLGRRMDIIHAAELRQGVMFLQGSASYMMKALELEDGNLYTKEDVLTALGNRMREGDKNPPEEMDMPHVYTLNNLSNYVYARSLFSSTVTPATYFVAKRECKTLYNDTLYTQLWAGYAAKLADKCTEPVHVLFVDIGSGEMKRYHCVLKPNGPIQKRYTLKDSQSTEKYIELLKKILSKVEGQLATDHENVSRKGRETPDHLSGRDGGYDEPDWPNILRNELQELGQELLSKKLLEEYTSNRALKRPKEVHFLATAATRAIFDCTTSPKTSDNNQHIKNHAKNVVRKCMGQDQGVLQNICRSAGLEDCHVEFHILEQAEEAKFEYAAAKAACMYATDLDPRINQSRLPPVNLAWGKGSTQGFCWHPPRTSVSSTEVSGGSANFAVSAESSLQVLQVNVGLTSIQHWITDWVKQTKEECKDYCQQSIATIKTVGGKKWIGFATPDARKELEVFVRAKIQKVLRVDSTRESRYRIKVYDVQ